MTADKQCLPNAGSASSPSDPPPPSYDAILVDHKSPPQASWPSPAVSPPVGTLELVKKPKGKLRRPVPTAWYNLHEASSSVSRAPSETQRTIESLLREIVEKLCSDLQSSLAILSSCEGACETLGLSFSDIIQRKFIEGHSPVYWAIVKRLPDDHHEAQVAKGPDLLSAFIFYATPLKGETAVEIREACVAISDQNLFSRLKKCPAVGIMYYTDMVLLGVQFPLDEIDVEEDTGIENTFAVNIVVPQFQKRMKVSGAVLLEFIARGMLRRYYSFVLRFIVSS